MRHTELRARLEAVLGGGYVEHWAATQVLAGLDGRTVNQALEAGVTPKAVWSVVRETLELPASER